MYMSLLRRMHCVCVAYGCRHPCAIYPGTCGTTERQWPPAVCKEATASCRQRVMCCFFATSMPGFIWQQPAYVKNCWCLPATQHTSQVACQQDSMPDLQLVAAQALHTNIKSVSSSQVARLWAGYGTVTAVQAVTDSPATGPGTGGTAVHHLIVKQVRG